MKTRKASDDRIMSKLNNPGHLKTARNARFQYFQNVGFTVDVAMASVHNRRNSVISLEAKPIHSMIMSPALYPKKNFRCSAREAKQTRRLVFGSPS